MGSTNSNPLSDTQVLDLPILIGLMVPPPPKGMGPVLHPILPAATAESAPIIRRTELQELRLPALRFATTAGQTQSESTGPSN